MKRVMVGDASKLHATKICGVRLSVKWQGGRGRTEPDKTGRFSSSPSHQKELMYIEVVSTATRSDTRRAARLFHALSDETRVALVEMLHDGERCVCELQDALGAAQSRLSFHLKVLKDAGMVNDRKEGRWVYYSLNTDAFAELEDVVAELEPKRRALPVRRASGCCD